MSQLAAFAFEYGQFVGRRILSAHRTLAIHLKQEVVGCDMPAAEHRMARTLFFKIIVVVGIELSFSSFDADNTRRQLAGNFLQVGRRSSRTPVTRREHVEVAVVGSPNGLVVLRFLASAGKADFIGFTITGVSSKLSPL